MAIIENIINVLVPLLICGLIFIYFRRRITNLEQSIDIIMKMLQTNQLNSGSGVDSHSNQENHLVDPSPDDVYVPSSDGKEIKKIEMNNLDLEETNDSDSESDESESESSDSESDSDTEDSESEDEKKEPKLLEIEKLDNTTNIEDLTSIVTSQEEETETNNDKSEETKNVVLNEYSTKEELEKKTLIELKKMLKEKVPDINNLSRMNKATVIENLMN